MKDNSPKRKHERFRIDLAIEAFAYNDDTGIMNAALIFDPRRYEKKDLEGKSLYWDKYLDYYLPEDVMGNIADQGSGLPIYHMSPKIDDSSAYAENRLEALRSELVTGTHLAPQEKPYPQSKLGKDAGRPVTFISVDICGATALRGKDAAAFDQAHEILIRELGTVVGQFGGSILKPTGDGFIAFNDQESFTNQCDNTINMGITLIHVLRDSVNLALKEKGLPELHVRLGAEHGDDAVLKEFNIPAMGFTAIDAVSDALNRAVKIQETCGIDEFRIGRRLYELIHVQWLERAKEVQTELTDQLGISHYKIYRVH